MSAQFFSKLSENYIELLDDDEYHDITVEVGEDPNVKIFRAHKSILCCRSPYLRRALTSNKKNKDNALVHLKLSNMSPEIFQIILKYIYGGIFPSSGQDNSEIIKVILAADEFLLQELVDYLQKYLIENKSEWMEQHFELIHRTSFQSNSLLQLQQFCTDFMVKSPEKVFKSLDFTSLPEKSLVQLIKRDDLQMKEVEIWDHVFKWGLAQNSNLLPDPKSWSNDDFEKMKNTLQHCLSLIRFFSLSSKDFLQKVRPYKKLLKRQLYENLLNFHLDPDSEPTDNIPLPRNIKIDGIIDSKIINNLSIISLISRCIDNVNSKFSHIREMYLPYKFQLLLRGSRDGFTPKKFHELCNDVPHTVTFIKVKGTEEILGGYNPTIWKSSGWGRTKDSFIFSFKNNNVKDAIISNIINVKDDMYHAVDYWSTHGPFFGNDLIVRTSGEHNDYDNIYCKKKYYEKKIRDTEDGFSMDDYEVFQIIRR